MSRKELVAAMVRIIAERGGRAILAYDNEEGDKTLFSFIDYSGKPKSREFAIHWQGCPRQLLKGVTYESN